MKNSRSTDESKSVFGENEDGSKSQFGENKDGSNSKFGENEDESKSKIGENFIQRCTLCNYQMHESQIVYMYNDRAFCCHRCRAKVMALDRVQTFAARAESEDCPKEIISLSNQLS